jgi:hypothetical protein
MLNMPPPDIRIQVPSSALTTLLRMAGSSPEPSGRALWLHVCCAIWACGDIFVATV